MVFGVKYVEINGNTEISHPCHGDSIRRIPVDKSASQRLQSKSLQTEPLSPSLSITFRKITDLSLDPQNPRIHSKRQIKQIAKSIKTFGFLAPVLIDGRGQLIAGHGRVLAAQFLGMTQVPTIKLEHLNDSQISAYMIADNRLTEHSVWDKRLLAQQCKALSEIELNFSVDVTGFELGEIEVMIEGLVPASNGKDEPTDAIPDSETKRQVTQAGDVWVLNGSPVGRSNARGNAAHSISMQDQGNSAVLSDPRHVDKIVRRWRKSTGLEAVHQGTGQTFAQRENEIADAQQ
jgi:hypothetical protein